MPHKPQESLVISKAINTYRDEVSRREVALSYLEAEMTNIIGANVQSDNGGLNQSLDSLTDDQVFRLLEGMSYSYRLNGVFHFVTDLSNRWMEVELPIDAIKLTGTKPHVNDIVYSADIDNRTGAFVDYLVKYFDQYPDATEDPLGLNEFRPRASLKELGVSKILAVERNEAIEIVDGTHRLLASALQGAVSVRAFAAIHSGMDSVSMKGDSTFLTMRRQYEAALSDEERETILRACILLAGDSTDGREAIQTYWIDHPRQKELRAAGKRLLSHLAELQ